MNEQEEARSAQAAAAGVEQIQGFLHDPSPRVVRTLLGNRSLQEEDILVITNRKNLPSDVLEAIARDKRWADSYPVKLALAKNPKTPISVSLSIVRYLRLFDIAEMTRNRFLPMAFRHKIETIIIERIPAMSLGYKKSLAKMAAGAVLFMLLQDADAEVVSLCLGNPQMHESLLFKLISRKDSRPETIRMIADHRTWSTRSLVRYALVRNDHTPLVSSERFLRTARLLELRELYADPSLPAGVKPLVYREMQSRGHDPREKIEEQVYEIDENDDEALNDIPVEGGQEEGGE